MFLNNECVYDSKKENDTLLVKAKYNYRILSTLYATIVTTNADGIIHNSVDMIVQLMGLKLDKYSRNEIKKDLQLLNELNYFEKNDYDFLHIGNGKLLTLKSNFLEVKDGKPIKYFNVTEEAFNKIMSNDKKTKYKLFAFYCYLMSRIHKRGKEVPLMYIEDQGSKNARVTYPTDEHISKNDLKISEHSVAEYRKMLSDMDLIRFSNNGQKVRFVKGQIEKKNSRIMYTDFREHWEVELNAALDWDKHLAKQEGWEFENDSVADFSNRKRALTNSINRNQALLKKAVSTEDKSRYMSKITNAVQEKEKLIEIKTDKDGLKNKIFTLFEQYPGMSLHEIYAERSNIYNDNTSSFAADDVYDWTYSVGLIDDEGKIVVEYNKYKHVCVQVICNEMTLEHAENYVRKLSKINNESNVIYADNTYKDEVDYRLNSPNDNWRGQDIDHPF